MRNDFGIVFDFNGTLFLDSDINEWAWRKFVKEKWDQNITDEEFRRYFHGVNNRTTLERYAGRELSESEIWDLTENGKEKIYRNYIKAHPERQILIKGAEAFFDYLVSKDIPFTIATAAGKNNLDFFCEILNLDKWFDRNKIVYDNGEIPSKPEPEFYLRAFEKIGVLPENGLVFEDAESGIKSASRAGVKRIVGIDPDQKNHLEEIPEVERVVKDLSEYRLLL